ncbi:MAG: hypothetical protein U5M53_12715 [Rhodoferax sp.]|nr:hypothetical protein [Rhodoferax sp.]
MTNYDAAWAYCKWPAGKISTNSSKPHTQLRSGSKKTWQRWHLQNELIGARADLHQGRLEHATLGDEIAKPARAPQQH